jgi:hypothetical protein
MLSFCINTLDHSGSATIVLISKQENYNQELGGAANCGISSMHTAQSTSHLIFSINLLISVSDTKSIIRVLNSLPLRVMIFSAKDFISKERIHISNVNYELQTSRQMFYYLVFFHALGPI